MKNTRSKNIKLGIFVSIGVLLLVLTIYFLGKEQNLFKKTITIEAVFHNVKGLKVGNKVRFSGINVGTVNKIKIISDSTIMVEMGLDGNVINFIKEDSKATIATEGLMGSKIIEITPGSPTSSHVAEGDRLVTVDPVELDDIMNEVNSATEAFNIIVNDLGNIVEKVNNGEGVFGVLLNDTTVGNELELVSANMLDISRDVDQIVNKINNGHGDLGRFVNDEALYVSVDSSLGNLNSIVLESRRVVENLENFTQKLEQGEGLINKLITDTTFAKNMDALLENTNHGVQKVTETADAIEDSWVINLFSGNKKEKKKERGKNEN